MDYKKLSFGLGLFSIALGAAELLASRRIARALEADGKQGLIKAFGGREMLAGVNLLARPAVATGMWNRVGGDAMDLAALGLAARNAPRNKAVWGAAAFVIGATLIDVLAARGLDRSTGNTLPDRAGRTAAAA
ncbi:MAG: hypothetical protein ACTHJR_17315 [Sphingomonas sp.]|uniref:hypothetical protein n=1 Tax=Sphingomonas sp. TaxID=28214 RepID=UPI003F7FC33D